MSVDGFGLVKDEQSLNISNLVKPNVMNTTINNKKSNKITIRIY